MAVVGLVESGDKEQLEKKLEELKAKNCAKELYERNLYGHSPIDLAALLGREDLLQLLLDNGVEVNSVNKSGRRQLMESIIYIAYGTRMVHCRVHSNALQCSMGSANMSVYVSREGGRLFCSHSLQGNPQSYGRAIWSVSVCQFPKQLR